MNNLLCIEIPKDEKAGMICISLDNEDIILVKDYTPSDFKFALENFKFIEFDSVALVKSVDPPTDDHGWVYAIEGDWYSNVGYKVDMITSYYYI